MNKKIIAFSGTHGSGKSSLAYMLCAKMKLVGYSVVVLDELARRCPFEINKEADDKTQVWLICRQVIEELELTNQYEYVIVDRSVLDSYCYDLVVNGEITTCDHLVSYISAHIQKYYSNIYVPDMNSFNHQVDDGTRDMDPEFRIKVYDTITRSYERFSIPHKIIHSIEEVYEDLGLIK